MLPDIRGDNRMIRAISIVLVVAIALQTAGCSSWRHLARASDVIEDESQSTMQDRVLGKLKEGMAVRIKIRESTPAPIKGRVIECIIEEIGQTSLTLIPITDHIRGTAKREFSLHFTDILHIEYRKFDRGLSNFTLGVAAGATLGLVLLVVALSQVELD